MSLRWRIVIFLVWVTTFFSMAQKAVEQFKLVQGDLVWHQIYNYPGKSDSLRSAVVQMLKSKFYTFNIIRNEAGYNGEIKHYKIDCKLYGRSYFNTPRLYWEGEWTGKFIVQITDLAYQVTVYALYYESKTNASDYFKTEKEVKGRYIDVVTRKDRSIIRKAELSNLALMGQSLRDAFKLSAVTLIQN